MTTLSPKELSLGQVYLPPVLVAVMIAYVLAALTLSGLGYLGLARSLHAPALLELSLVVIYAVAISQFLLPG